MSYAGLQGNSQNIIVLDRCVNSGEVTMSGAVSNGACGGIIGYLYEKKANTATITNCANKADVSAGGTIQCMGGIVGKFQSSSDIANCYVYNCYSTGDLKSSGTVNATNSGMGGIMAIYKSSTMYKIEINNCYFSGSLEATGGMTNYSGIVSKKDDNITCDNCYSVNNCTGVGSAAGISITSITNAGTLLSNLKTIASSSGWSDWKEKTGTTYPVFSWE